MDYKINGEELLKTQIYEMPYQKEKDYIEELFLTGIYAAASELVFKGGTAISKFYGSVRFSDDLDFSYASNYTDKKNVVVKLDRVIDKVSKECPLKIMRKKNNTKMLAYELSIRGPLFGMLNKYQHLKIEVDKNASVLRRTNVFRRNPVYADLKPYVAVVMSEKEILSEKVVALLFRHNLKARDLYDIYFLMHSGTTIEVNMIDKKMAEYGHTFTKDRLFSRLDDLGSIWNKELRRLLPVSYFLEYNEAKEYLIARFKDADMI